MMEFHDETSIWVRKDTYLRQFKFDQFDQRNLDQRERKKFSNIQYDFFPIIIFFIEAFNMDAEFPN